MELDNYKATFESIVSDTSKGSEERIEEILSLKEEIEFSEEREALVVDEFCYSLLIQMLINENATLSNIEDLMHLYSLLAETLDEEGNYPPIKDIAHEVIEMIRINAAPWDIIKETLPELIDAVNDTVYHHISYNLHLWLLKKAFEANDLNEDLKGRARHLLKLRILLERPDRHEYLLDKPLQEAIARLFTPDELVKIILNPQLGHLRQDPVEFTYIWEDIYYDVEKRLDERFANAPRQMGFCFLYWNAKREILKNEYGIDWKSPSQMNPRVKFD